MRVGHSQERAGIDSDELDEKSSSATEDQIGCENLAGLFVGCGDCARAGVHLLGGPFFSASAAGTGRADVPEPPCYGAGGYELIDGGRVNAFDGGDQPVRKAHAPGQGGWDAVITVTGKKAADPADPVSEGGSRRARIKN